MTEIIYRPGLEGIVAGETSISSVADGLRYRGYRVEELADRCQFEQVAWLLQHGELPNDAELADFREQLAASTTLPSGLMEMLRALPAEANMMDTLRTAVSWLGLHDPDAADNAPAANRRKSMRLLGQVPLILATRQRLRNGFEPGPWSAERSIAGNLLALIQDADPDADDVRALNVSLIAYADIGFAASTFAARVCASTLADLHGAIVAGIAALKGPLHGGANERAMRLMRQFDSVAAAREWTHAAIAAKTKVMGFGHRIYRQGDPRAPYLKQWCTRLAERRGDRSLEAIADTVAEILQQEKGLLPNVDWPCARLYHYLGLPEDLYTPLFVVGRMAGWTAHICEQHAHNRIMRPLSDYQGPAAREFDVQPPVRHDR